MELEIEQGLHRQKPGLNPLDYPHNKLIHELFRRARIVAWAQLKSDPDVMNLMAASRRSKQSRLNKSRDPELSRSQYNEVRQLLEMTNK